MRLDRFLLARGELGTRSQIQRLIREGHVHLASQPVKAGTPLRAGQCVTVERQPHAAPLLEAEAIDLSVLYEDDALMVINKPAGLVVHPAPGHWSGTLVNALLHRWRGQTRGMDLARLGLVHRLDKDTSGVLIIAKDAATLAALGQGFRRREVEKRYLALAWGRFRRPAGVIRAPIARHPVHRQRMAVRPGGREAVTRYEVVEQFDDVSFVRLSPETGRTHQIRVHLAATGHPIVADAHYAGRRRESALPISRQALHAESIAFEHPTLRTLVRVSAPLPADLIAALRALRSAQRV